MRIITILQMVGFRTRLDDGYLWLTISAEQTFGIDLEARARADRKRVPTIITSILQFLDHREWLGFR
jgi:hypothetical protein